MLRCVKEVYNIASVQNLHVWNLSWEKLRTWAFKIYLSDGRVEPSNDVKRELENVKIKCCRVEMQKWKNIKYSGHFQDVMVCSLKYNCSTFKSKVSVNIIVLSQCKVQPCS